MEDALGAVQSILVLGGSSEIAAAIVRRLVARRAGTVVLAARTPGSCDGLAEELRGAGAEVDVVAFDALDVDHHAAVVDDVVRRHGDLDLVLLAFGELGDQATFDADPAAAARAVDVTYTGGVSAGLAVAAQLRRQGHGTLVVLSSVAGERARRDNFVYGSAKAGLDAFAQGLGDALVDTGARVMVVRPGFVHTRMTAGLEPAPFSTTPEAVADVVLDGLARRREVVWAPPVLRWLFVVLRHLPRPLWRRASAR